MDLARRTWSVQPWKEIPVGDDDVRCFIDHMGRVPFVKDIINFASRDKDDKDIIVLTNADICVSQNCSFKITGAMQCISAAYCFRRDFPILNEPLKDPAIKHGHHYCGSDLYAFRVGWWRQYVDEFPDMMLGREAWDSVFRILIEMTHPGQDCTLHNLIYHERHASVWENPRNRRSIPSQIHNINLAKAWMLSFGHNPSSIGL